jgi:hypothetical protein
MGVRKTESRIPANFKPDDLGQSAERSLGIFLPSVRLDTVTDPFSNGLSRTVYGFGTFEGESDGIGVVNKWPPRNFEDGKGSVIRPDYVDGPGENLRAHHQDCITSANWGLPVFNFTDKISDS